MTNLGLLVPKLSAMEIGRDAGYFLVVREIRHTCQKDGRQADGGRITSPSLLLAGIFFTDLFYEMVYGMELPSSEPVLSHIRNNAAAQARGLTHGQHPITAASFVQIVPGKC